MKHKKQHYVPSSYLKAWCDKSAKKTETPYVWIFPKSGGPPRRKAPDNIFNESDFYTIGKDSEIRDLSLEHRMQRIETKFVGLRKSFEHKRELTEDEHATMCLFVAAMKIRTKGNRDFQAEQWRKPLEMMESMMEQWKIATLEEKKNMARYSLLSHNDNSEKLGYEDVKRLVEKPIQNLLMPTIAAMAPLLVNLDIAVLETKSIPGFITSDDPCVMHDPEGYKRPFLLRGPGLAYKTTEITLPISPQQILLLNQQGVEGYIKIDDKHVEAINARTRYFSNNHIIVNCNMFKESWFDGTAQ